MKIIYTSVLCVLISIANAQNTFPSSGNVGIGTTSPQAKLHVANGDVLFQNPSSGYPVLYFKDVAGANVLRFDYNSIIHSGGNLLIRSGGTNNLLLNDSGGGNVGIGTSLPQTKFQIDISSSNTNYSNLNWTDIGLFLKNASTTTDNMSIISFGDASNYGIAHIGAVNKNQTSHSGELFFATKPTSSSLIKRMVITEDGKVGIATLTPDSQLAVNGTIHSKEVKVDLNNWPDYVFEKNYQLTSLGDLKTYIEKNLHLPELPAAKEVETEGVKLGEMNALLLKKIEEMTLHLIRQQEEIDALKAALGKD